MSFSGRDGKLVQLSPTPDDSPRSGLRNSTVRALAGVLASRLRAHGNVYVNFASAF